MATLKKLKVESWETYKYLRNKKIYCPAFGENIIFSLRGWYHLTKPAGHSRIPADLSRRYRLLKYAEEIITKSHTVQNVKTVNCKTFFALEAVMPVDGNTTKILKKIRVVIIDTKAGKTFLSILDK